MDKKQLLTVEQSIDLREEISNQEAKFLKLIESKNLEIVQLNGIIEEYRTKNLPNQHDFSSTNETTKGEILEYATIIKSDPQKLKDYDRIVQLTQGGYKIADRSDIHPKTIAYLEANNIIESSGAGVYKFTNTGKKLLKVMSE